MKKYISEVVDSLFNTYASEYRNDVKEILNALYVSKKFKIKSLEHDINVIKMFLDFAFDEHEYRNQYELRIKLKQFEQGILKGINDK